MNNSGQPAPKPFEAQSGYYITDITFRRSTGS